MIDGMKDLLKSLNKEQKDAVTHDSGPLLIVAGAGTGKTTVITHRIAYLIAEKKALPSEILALTFTDKAAAEMEERVDELVPYGFVDTWISTFHAFGDRILRDHALDLGLTTDFRVLSRPEQVIFMQDNLDAFDLKYFSPLGNPMKHIGALLDHFSKLKDELIEPAEYLGYADRRLKMISPLSPRAKQSEAERSLKKNSENKRFLRSSLREVSRNDNDEIIEAEKALEIARAYERYGELMAEAGNLDFGDQINIAIKLFREHPKILKKYQKQFRYILVDEFQDTNYAQNELLKLLAGTSETGSKNDSGQARMTEKGGYGNITVVGDDDQCLPGNSLIQTPDGAKEIRNIKVRDLVLSGIGKGHIGTSQVSEIFKRKKRARLITFKTKSGKEITVTSNHKMFCYLSGKPNRDLTYVYLMENKKLGWRIGITNNLKQRLKFERGANRIIGIKVCETLDEALYWETILSLKYNIPTICFKDRRGVEDKTQWLEKVFSKFDTEKSAKKLAGDLGIDLSGHHYSPQGVVRGDQRRVKVILEMNARKYRGKEMKNKLFKNYKVSHLLSIETSDKETIKILKKNGFPISKARGNGLRYREMSSDLKTLSDKAEKICSLTDGILECVFKAGTDNIQHRPAICVDASNVLKGMYLPVINGNKVFYDEVTEVSSQIKKLNVYDIEVEKTHNFIANDVVVHNSIYRFRGAAISNILSFTKDYPGCRQIVLTENYRSTQAILDSAYKMIKHNDPDRLEVKNNIVKKLKSKVGIGKNSPIHIHCDTVTSEADKVANIIKEKYESGEYSLKDFAILARSRGNAQAFIHALDHAGISYKFSGSAGLYDRPEVRLLIHFARTLTNPGDNLAFYHLLTSDVYNMPVEDAVKLNEISHKTKRNLNHIAKTHIPFQSAGREKKMEISVKSRAILDRVCVDIENFREQSKDMTAGQLIYAFLKETRYLSRLVTEAEKSADAQAAIQNIARFFELIGNFEKVSEDKSTINFVRHFGTLMEAGDNPAIAEVDPDLEAVSVLTVHKSKGLEFPVVFLVSLVNYSFPTKKRSETLPIPEELIKETLPKGDWHLQEERRLFYVGMTRAKKVLYLTSAEDYGGKRTRKVSLFVLEAIDMPSLAKEKTKLDKTEVIKRFEKTEKTEVPKKFYDGKGTLTLNPHQVDDYLSCPKKFEYIHVLKVPIMTHHSVIYGSAIHKAIEEYYVRKKAGMKVAADDLIEVFNNNWRSEGFITREHEDKRRSQGEKSLRAFFSREEANGILPDKVEAKFEIPMKDLGVKVRGRFDAVFKLPITNSKQIYESANEDTNNKEIIEIRDFKTSEVESQKQADKKARSNRQLAIYALAKGTETGVIPEVSLYFVDSGLIGKVEKKEKDLDRTKEEILKVVEGIKKENFKPAPGYQECSRCAYREICPFTLSR